MYNKIIVHHIMFHINQNCSSRQLSVCVATIGTCFNLKRQLSSYTCTCGNEKKTNKQDSDFNMCFFTNMIMIHREREVYRKKEKDK